MHKSIYFLWLLLITTLIANKSYASNICVTNSAEFQIALDTAENNGENDHIKLQSGNYPIFNGSSFSYIAAIGENFDLKITGGYIEFLGNPCGLIALNTSALDTELDGLSLDRILNIRPRGNNKIEVSALYFVAGSASGPVEGGGGLYIGNGGNFTGEVLIENNAFVGNESATVGGSAMQMLGGKNIVRNNLVTANSGAGSAITMTSTSTGNYLTNNTVMDNITSSNGTNIGAVTINAVVSTPDNAFVANNILWGNDLRDLRFFGNNTFLYNNDIGIYSGVPVDESGNFSAVPEFTPSGLPGNTTYIPAYNSNLYNQGIEPPTFTPPIPPFQLDWEVGANDTFGHDRIVNERIDIGSIETPQELPIFKNGFEEQI